jgi:hypothetical protein
MTGGHHARPDAADIGERSAMRFPQLSEMAFRRDQLAAVLRWPLCALRRHPEHYEIAAADTVSLSDASAIVAGLRPPPEPTGQTIRYFSCRCGAHTRSEPA